MKWFALLLCCAGIAGAEDDLYKKAQPILRESCYSCHGQNKQKGGLRLDSLDAINKGGKNGPAIAPGDSKNSALAQRISLPDDHEDVMPAKGDHLSAEQIAVIAAWIDAMKPAAGAKPAKAAPKPADKAADKAVADEPREKIELPDTDLDAAAKNLASVDEKSLKELDELGIWSRSLSKNGALIEVDCSQVALGGDGIVKAVAKLGDHVAWLDLANSKITDAHLASLAELKNLRRLHLENTEITDAGMPAVAALSGLEYLNLHGTKVDDEGLLKLTALKKLTALYLPKSRLKKETVETLKKEIPGLVINGGE